MAVFFLQINMKMYFPEREFSSFRRAKLTALKQLTVGKVVSEIVTPQKKQRYTTAIVRVFLSD